MSALSRFFKQKKRNGARPMFAMGDATDGLECNRLSPNRKVSRYIYSVDIARNPNVIKEVDGKYMRMNIHNKANGANWANYKVNSDKTKVTGR